MYNVCRIPVSREIFNSEIVEEESPLTDSQYIQGGAQGTSPLEEMKKEQELCEQLPPNEDCKETSNYLDLGLQNLNAEEECKLFDDIQYFSEPNNNRIKRFQSLETAKFLTYRIFPRVSENMHYEIFKYATPIDLLQVRIIKLGGFQLISNTILRSRIKNYMSNIKPIFDLNLNEDLNARRIRLLFQQTGSQRLNLNNMQITYKEIVDYSKFLMLVPKIQILNLCRLIYILYRYEFNWD